MDKKNGRRKVERFGEDLPFQKQNPEKTRDGCLTHI